MVVLGFGEDVGRGVLPWGVGWCFRHTIGDSGRWGSTCDSQGRSLGLFAGKYTAELEEVAVYQCGVSPNVETLHAWVVVMIKTDDG